MRLNKLQLLWLHCLCLFSNLLLLFVGVENFAKVLGHEDKTTLVRLIHFLVSNAGQNLKHRPGGSDKLKITYLECPDEIHKFEAGLALRVASL